MGNWNLIKGKGTGLSDWLGGASANYKMIIIE
jgi:hypothetical protein